MIVSFSFRDVGTEQLEKRIKTHLKQVMAIVDPDDVTSRSVSLRIDFKTEPLHVKRSLQASVFVIQKEDKRAWPRLSFLWHDTD